MRSIYLLPGLLLACQLPEPPTEFVAPEPPPVGFQLTMRPVEIPPGEDLEFCAYFNLDTPEDLAAHGEEFLLQDLVANGIDPQADEIAIGAIDVRGAAGLHHIQILALENDVEDVPDRHIFECGVDLFGGPLTGDVDPLFFTSNDNYRVTYPEGIARVLKRTVDKDDESRTRGTQLLYNFHYVNPTLEPITAEVVVNLHAVPIETVEHPIRSAWWNFVYFKAAKGELSSADARGSFLVDVNLVGMTSHQHETGSLFTYSMDGEEIYRNKRWDEPVYLSFPEGKKVKAGEPIDFRCEWDNPFDRNIYFGLQADDEMCTAIIEYYPDDEEAANALLEEQRIEAEKKRGDDPFSGELISLEHFIPFPDSLIQELENNPDADFLEVVDLEIMCGIAINLKQMEEQYGRSPDIISLQGLLEFLSPICRL